jgi:hypothetical protein
LPRCCKRRSNTTSTYQNSPDSNTPISKETTPAAGIDLCDSAVMAPAFKTDCS